MHLTQSCNKMGVFFRRYKVITVALLAILVSLFSLFQQNTSLLSNQVFAQAQPLSGTWTQYSLPNNNVYAIAEDDAGDIWIGTQAGVVRYDGQNWTVYNTQNSGLLSNWVLKIFKDNSGNMWFGTWGSTAAACGGVTKFDGTSWTTFTTSNSGLATNCVGAIGQDNEGSMWFGYPNIGWIPTSLTKYDGINWFSNYSPNSIGVGPVSAIVTDLTGVLWVGGNISTVAVASFDGSTWTGYPEASFNSTRAIAVDSLNHKWIGSDMRVFYYDGNEFQFAGCRGPRSISR